MVLQRHNGCRWPFQKGRARRSALTQSTSPLVHHHAEAPCSWLASRGGRLSLFFFFFIHTHIVSIECHSFAITRNQYNFQQWISWLSHRWRTQRNAIRNVNCRIQWIIESLNAPCTPWHSEGYTRLSVVKFSNLLGFYNQDGFGLGGLLLALGKASSS